jgi:hypothetical protein
LHMPDVPRWIARISYSSLIASWALPGHDAAARAGAAGRTAEHVVVRRAKQCRRRVATNNERVRVCLVPAARVTTSDKLKRRGSKRSLIASLARGRWIGSEEGDKAQTAARRMGERLSIGVRLSGPIDSFLSCSVSWWG